MKSKLALILGIVCIVISALTLFSVLGHADPASSTLTFFNADGLSGSIKGVSILSNNPRIVRLDVSPMNFPKAGELTKIFIEFADEYEASIARDLFMTQKMDLTTPYLLHTAGAKYQSEVVPFVNSEGRYSLTEAPQGVLLIASRVQVNEGNTLRDVVSKQIREKQLKEGIYIGPYGKMMWVWDGLNCQGKAYEKDKCHEESSFTQK